MSGRAWNWAQEAVAKQVHIIKTSMPMRLIIPLEEIGL